jgi:hypothetical protein
MGDGNPTQSLKVTLKIPCAKKKRIGQQIAHAISEKPSTSRERPHHQINPNDQIMTQSPINIHIQEKKTLKLKILTHVIIYKVFIFISPIARIFL